MKKLFLILSIVGTTLTATAQKKNAAQEIYDKLEQEDDVLTLSFNKKMIDAIDSDVEWGEEMRYLNGDLDKVKLMIIEEGNASKIAKYIFNKLDDLGYKLTDLPKDIEDERDDDDEVFLFTNKKGSRFSEAHILVVDEEGGAIFLSVYGDINVSEQKI